jgi:hypothetical protein
MRNLNARQKLFLETIVKENFYAAMKATSYAKSHAYRILEQQKAKDYLMSIIQKTANKLNLTHEGLIQERLELARDPETPANVKDKILKDLADMLERIEDKSDDNNNKRLPFNLKPAALKQAEVVDAKEVK